MVLDTDYDNYLVTYQCREELRKPNENDFMLTEPETYRQIIESYNGEQHDQFIAQRAITHLDDNRDFAKWQANIMSEQDKKEAERQELTEE